MPLRIIVWFELLLITSVNQWNSRFTRRTKKRILVYCYSILSFYWSSVQMKLHQQSKARAMNYCTSGHSLSQVLHATFELNRKFDRMDISDIFIARLIYYKKYRNYSQRIDNLKINFSRLNQLLHHVRPYLFLLYKNMLNIICVYDYVGIRLRA